MKTIAITDLQELHSLLRPSREKRLAHAMDEMEAFFQKNYPSVVFDASVLLDLMDDLTNDLSKVLDAYYAEWSREYTIDTIWDLSCQCARTKNLCEYGIYLWKHRKNAEQPYQVYPVMKWTEKLPEKH